MKDLNTAFTEIEKKREELIAKGTYKTFFWSFEIEAKNQDLLYEKLMATGKYDYVSVAKCPRGYFDIIVEFKRS